LAESVGVNVAVMSEVPRPTTVKVDPDTLITDVVPDAYENVPGTDPVTEGAVTENEESP
jgi:hypothetical protein